MPRTSRSARGRNGTWTASTGRGQRIPRSGVDIHQDVRTRLLSVTEEAWRPCTNALTLQCPHRLAKKVAAASAVFTPSQPDELPLFARVSGLQNVPVFERRKMINRSRTGCLSIERQVIEHRLASESGDRARACMSWVCWRVLPLRSSVKRAQVTHNLNHARRASCDPHFGDRLPMARARVRA